MSVVTNTHDIHDGDASARPCVFVISGPTAVGKGTLIRIIKQRYPDVYVSISATTRQPRPTETDGVDYFFVTDAEFDDLITHDGLLEWAEVHGSTRYGTPRKAVSDAVAAGKTVILEIDLQGARQIRRTMPDAVQIFIQPPSWDELVRRLRGRGSETKEQQQRRLQTARIEMDAAAEFDHIVVNDVLGETVNTLVSLLGL